MGPFEQMVPEPCFQQALSLEVSARLSLGRRHFDPTRFSLHTREAPPQREARIHRPYSCVSQAVALLSGASYLQAWRPEVLGAEQPVGSPFLPVPTSLLRPSCVPPAGLTARRRPPGPVLCPPWLGLFLAAWRPACPGQHGAHSAPGHPAASHLFGLAS